MTRRPDHTIPPAFHSFPALSSYSWSSAGSHGKISSSVQTIVCITPRAAVLARARLSFNLNVQLTVLPELFSGAFCSRLALGGLSTALPRSPFVAPSSMRLVQASNVPRKRPLQIF